MPFHTVTNPLEKRLVKSKCTWQLPALSDQRSGGVVRLVGDWRRGEPEGREAIQAVKFHANNMGYINYDQSLLKDVFARVLLRLVSLNDEKCVVFLVKTDRVGHDSATRDTRSIRLDSTGDDTVRTGCFHRGCRVNQNDARTMPHLPAENSLQESSVHGRSPRICTRAVR